MSGHPKGSYPAKKIFAARLPAARNMVCGMRGEDLIVRVAAEEADAALGETGARPVDLTGRPMKGWLLVAADGHAEDEDLRRWVNQDLATASSLRPRSSTTSQRPGDLTA